MELTIYHASGSKVFFRNICICGRETETSFYLPGHQ